MDTSSELIKLMKCTLIGCLLGVKNQGRYWGQASEQDTIIAPKEFMVSLETKKYKQVTLIQLDRSECYKRDHRKFHEEAMKGL